MIGNASTSLGALLAGLRSTLPGMRPMGEAGSADFSAVVAGLAETGSVAGIGGKVAVPAIAGDEAIDWSVPAPQPGPSPEGLILEGAPPVASGQNDVADLLALIEHSRGKPSVPPAVLPAGEGLPPSDVPIAPDILLPVAAPGKKPVVANPVTGLLPVAPLESGKVAVSGNEEAAAPDEGEVEGKIDLAIDPTGETAIPPSILVPMTPAIMPASRTGKILYATADQPQAVPVDGAPIAMTVPAVAVEQVSSSGEQDVAIALPPMDEGQATVEPAPVSRGGEGQRLATLTVARADISATGISDIGSAAATPVAPPPALDVAAVPRGDRPPAAPLSSAVVISGPGDPVVATPMEPVPDLSTARDMPAPAQIDAAPIAQTTTAPVVPAAIANVVIANDAAPALSTPSTTVDVGQVVIGHHLDLARASAWLDQLTRDIVSAGANDTKLQFKLNPEHLGSLHVELIRGDDGASVRLTTESEAARTVLSDAQGRLVAEARAQGMKIAETHVDLSQQGGRDSGQRGPADGQSGQSSSQPQQPRVNASVTMKALDAERADRRGAPHERYA